MTDTLPCQKTYRTFPGILTEEQIMQYMTIECKIEYLVCKVFKIGPLALKDKRRDKEIIYAKHLYRYLFSCLVNPEADPCRKMFGLDKKRIFRTNTRCSNKYSLDEICPMVNCKRANLISSIHTAKNLIETDKDYRNKFETIISKLDTNLFEL